MRKLLIEFEKYIIKSQALWKVPGLAVGIAKNGKTLYRRGFGVKELGTNSPVMSKTVFQIGSISKAFTATLMAILIHEGKLRWHDKVVDFLPDFRMFDSWVTREFTIGDLFNHRTGLPFGVGLYSPLFGFDENYIVHVLRYIKPVSSFRLDFCYQNVFYIVAGQIIEKITGKSFESNLQNRIFKPLEMNYSSSRFKTFKNSKLSSSLHMTEGNQISPIPMTWPYHNWVDVFAAAGGIHSNISDMLKWLNFQLANDHSSEKILPYAEKTYLHTYRMPANDRTLVMIDPKAWNVSTYYGLGWTCGDMEPAKVIYHAGGSLGHVTMAAFIPEEKLCFTFLTNSKSFLAVALLRDFYDRYFYQRKVDWSEILYAEIRKNADAIKTPSQGDVGSDTTKFVGTYHSDIYGDIVVSKRGRLLTFHLGPRHVCFTLIPWGGNVFKMQWPNKVIPPNFMGSMPSFANFVCDPNGQATSVILTLLHDLDGFGEFKRIDKV